MAKAQSGKMSWLVRQAGGDVVLCAIGRRHHPNFAVTLDQAMSPSQDAPSGQGAHLCSVLFMCELFRYCAAVHSDAIVHGGEIH